MKNLLKYTAAIVGILSLQSCLKNNDSNQAFAAIRFVNASPGSPALDVYYNGASAATNIAFGGTSAQYYTALAGTGSLQVTPAGQTDYKINTQVTLQPGDFSIYFINSYTGIGATAVSDYFANFPNPDSVLVRFFQFSPGFAASSVKLFNTTDSIIYSNRTFNDQATNAGFQSFQYLKAGTYSVSYYAFGSSTPVKTSTGITLTGGKLYTLYAKGILGSADDLETGIEQHN